MNYTLHEYSLRMLMLISYGFEWFEYCVVMLWYTCTFIDWTGQKFKNLEFRAFLCIIDT